MTTQDKKPQTYFSLFRVLPLHEPMVITFVRIKPVLCVFPKVLTRKISLTIKSLFSCWLFPLFSWPPWVILTWYCKEKLDASQYWGGGGGVFFIINHFGWRGELRVKFFPRNYIKLNYECHQSQSTLHVLVCPGAIIWAMPSWWGLNPSLPEVINV